MMIHLILKENFLFQKKRINALKDILHVYVSGNDYEEHSLEQYNELECLNKWLENE